MAVIHYGGGGGGGAGTPIPGVNPNTGEILYTLDAGDLDNNGAGIGYPTLGGTYLRAPGNRSDLDSHYSDGANGLSASIGASNVKTGGAITVAFWIYHKAAPGANGCVVGMRDAGSGSAFNFPWEIGMNSSGQLRWWWQSGNKNPEGITFSANTLLPTNQWVHVMGTRNIAGTEAQLYFDGVEADSVTGQTAWSGGGSIGTLRILTTGAGVNPDSYINQVYVDDSFESDGAAFYQAALQVA
jgi:hypothetical protein